ncbi:MAG TPA: hypothetical protein VKD04_13770 [Burkholderiales bacterium]|nr:hypothetical protein [Burkholderiales bacterium]
MRVYTKLVAGCGVTALFLCLANVVFAGEFEGPLVACPADKTAIGDVGSCGKIWKLKSGKAELKADGRLEVEVKGLVLNDTSTGEFNGTPDGVDAVAAAVICNSPSGAAVAAQTEPVTLSKSGDARIKVKVSLPGGCIAPVIVLRERYEGKIGGWLASTGM